MQLPDELARDWMLHSDALTQLRVSRSTLYRYREAGLVECRTYAGRLIVRRADVTRIIRNPLPA